MNRKKIQRKTYTIKDIVSINECLTFHLEFQVGGTSSSSGCFHHETD